MKLGNRSDIFTTADFMPNIVKIYKYLKYIKNFNFTRPLLDGNCIKKIYYCERIGDEDLALDYQHKFKQFWYIRYNHLNLN
jgi:hypothetical protein